jgi:hypothetical protein
MGVGPWLLFRGLEGSSLSGAKELESFVLDSISIVASRWRFVLSLAIDSPMQIPKNKKAVRLSALAVSSSRTLMSTVQN